MLLSKISPIKETKKPVSEIVPKLLDGETIESLKKALSVRDRELKETRFRLRKQAEFYEEQFNNTHKKNVELEFRILEQETLIEELKEQLMNFNQIENHQSENANLTKQIQEELAKYKATVGSLENMIYDLQNRYELSRKREQVLEKQYQQAVEKMKEQEKAFKLVLTNQNNTKKEDEARVPRLLEALEYNNRLLISENLEILFLKAQLQLCREAAHASQKSRSQEEETILPPDHITQGFQQGEEAIVELKDIYQAYEHVSSQASISLTQEDGKPKYELSAKEVNLSTESNNRFSIWVQKFKQLIQKTSQPSLHIPEAQDSTSNNQEELRNNIDLIKELRYSIKELDLTNTLLEEKLRLNEVKTEQLEDYRNRVSYCEKEKEILREEFFKLNTSYVKLTDKYAELTTLLANIKSENMSALDFSQNPEADEIELKLAETLAQADVSNLEFRKISDGVFSIENEKYHLSLNKGILYLKENGASVPLIECLKALKKKDNLSQNPQQLEEKRHEPESGVLISTLNVMNLRATQRTKNSSFTEKRRLVTEDYTSEGENGAHVLNTEGNVESQPYKIASKSPVSIKKGQAIPKSSEKKPQVTRKSQSGINSPSFSLLKPKNFRDVSPILSYSKQHCSLKGDNKA